MPKHLTLGNGNLLIGLDVNAQVKDLYFHYAGLENHVGESLVHKVGAWTKGRFAWLDEPSWKVRVDSEKGTMASNILATNASLSLELKFNDVVYNEKNIFIRQVVVNSLSDKPRKVKLYFNQQFNIGQDHIGDTGYYDPYDNVMIHYKGRRIFLANVVLGDKSFSEYSAGLLGIEGKTGTYKDAEDGSLQANPIEHGQVDSVIGIEFDLGARKEKTLYYFIVVAKSIKKAKKLNKYVLERDPASVIKSTKDYWKAWVYNQNFSFYGLGDKIIELFNKSLIQIRTHVSTNGAIIASGDSSMLQFGRDTYSYVWPRDASVAATALARAGDFNASRRFFEFCSKVISEDGYFMHKYRPDYSLGSSWHPWIKDGVKQLPIQEDETALVIDALWVHFQLSKDLEFVESIYNSLIKSAAEFMTSYRDRKTGLPKPSYDLWEQRYGISTFTASSVFGALKVASKFAKVLGKEKNSARYFRAAESIGRAILEHLYDAERGTFKKLVNITKGEIVSDDTIDMSSAWGVYKFGVLKHDDPKLKKAMNLSRDALWVKTEVGGIARYVGDEYLRSSGKFPGNPWLITTLWYYQYLIESLRSESDLPDLIRNFTWVVDRALPSGILTEQINPETGEQISAGPLVWSHAEFVITIIKYLEKLEELGICKACYPVNK